MTTRPMLGVRLFEADVPHSSHPNTHIPASLTGPHAMAALVSAHHVARDHEADR